MPWYQNWCICLEKHNPKLLRWIDKQSTAPYHVIQRDILLLVLLHWKVVVGLSIVKQKLVVNLKWFNIWSLSQLWMRILWFSSSSKSIGQSGRSSYVISLFYKLMCTKKHQQCNWVRSQASTVFTCKRFIEWNVLFFLLFFPFLLALLLFKMRHFTLLMCYFHYIPLGFYSMKSFTLQSLQNPMFVCVNCTVIGFGVWQKKNLRSNNVELHMENFVDVFSIRFCIL